MRSRTRENSVVIAVLLLANKAWIVVDGHQYWMQGLNSRYAFLAWPGEHTIESNTALIGSLASMRTRFGRGTSFEPVTVVLSAGDAVGFKFFELFGKEGLKPTADRPDEIWTGLSTLDSEHVRPVPPDGESDLAKYAVTETHRTEEPIGQETRILDNLGNAEPTSRTIRVSREWSRTLEVGSSAATTMKGQLSAKLPLEITASVEKTLQQTYRLQDTLTQTVSEEVVVRVPGHTRLSLVFDWKQIVQHGVVRQGDVEVPFRLVVGVTFDQTQVSSTQTT